ncbi:MAG: hypothetical protein ACFFD9_00250 [Candidatus Thorarchaeota archaeon]
MSMLNRFSSPTDRIIERFTRYLNGPMGRTVLDALDEGESFILQTAEHTFRVTKHKGSAVVEILQVPVPKPSP